MRRFVTFPISLMLLVALAAGADAAPRVKGGHGRPPEKKKPKTEKPEVAPTPVPVPGEPGEMTPAEVIASTGKDAPKPANPALALANMIYFEFAQGVHDYSVEVIETESDLRTNAQSSIRKQIYYLAPATTLTLLDGQALNILSADLFARFLDGVDLAWEPDDVINGVACYVVRANPIEGAFKDNAKYYYLAKDDFRKIRIRAIKSDSIQQKKFWFINDFSYRKSDDGFLLPSNTQARLLTWEEIPLTLTQAVFQKYAINKGLEENFFAPYLKDVKYNDTYKD